MHPYQTNRQLAVENSRINVLFQEYSLEPKCTVNSTLDKLSPVNHSQ